MEIDAICRTTLTPQECETLQRLGGCFFCRGAGHMARDCPKKKKIVSAVELPEGDEDSEEGKD